MLPDRFLELFPSAIDRARRRVLALFPSPMGDAGFHWQLDLSIALPEPFIDGLVQVPVTVHTGPSERSSPSEPHAQTARPPLFMFPLLCSRSSSGVVIGPRLPIERELDPQLIRLRLGREGRSLARSLHR